MKAPGVQVPLQDAETTRRQLVANGTLRTELGILRDEATITFPVAAGDQEFEFPERQARARHYTDHLDWSDSDKQNAPRAFDVLGDLVLVKVPEELWAKREALGQALLEFHKARAVFHDGGVTGEFRVRDLTRIAGSGESHTTIQENGVTLFVNPSKAYFSPRLAHERERIASLVRRGERVIDLFGGGAPQGVQLARAGAKVTTIDLNPAANALAKANADANKVVLTCFCGDAREVAGGLQPVDRVIMNLPHGAKYFLDVGARLVKSGGWLHHHEIMRDDHLETRKTELAEIGRVANVRQVRAYSAQESHYVFDLEMP